MLRCLWLLLGLYLSLLCSDARAQICNSSSGWNSRHVFYDGVPGVDIPVAVSLRAWGPTNEVFLVYERRFPTEVNQPHRIYLKGYYCSDAVCAEGYVSTPYAQQQITGTLYQDQFAQPSTAIDTSSGGARKIAVVHRQHIVNGCDGDSTSYINEANSDPEARRLDLTEAQWYSNGTPTAGYNVEVDPTGDNVCTDRATPYARYDSGLGRTRACWRWDDQNPTSTDKHQIRCGRRNSDNTYSVTTISNTDPANAAITIDQDNPAFEIASDSERRIVVHRSTEGAEDNIRIRFPDDAGIEPVLSVSDGDSLVDDFDQPDIIQSSNGTWHVVWQSGYGTNSKIWHAWCDPVYSSLSCRSATNWTSELVEDDGSDLRHPQVNTDGNRVFITYMGDPGSYGYYRVQYKTRCSSSPAWEASIIPQTPCIPTTATDDQSMIMGRPSTGVDRGSNVFHVGYLQVDALDSLGRHNDGDVVWSTTTYTECP